MITTMIPDRSARNLGLGFPCPLRSWPPPPPPPPFPPLLSLQRAGSNYYSSKRTVLINASESVFWFNLHRLSQSNEMDDLDLIMHHNRKKTGASAGERKKRNDGRKPPRRRPRRNRLRQCWRKEEEKTREVLFFVYFVWSRFVPVDARRYRQAP